jgi:histidinol-phosphate aminotransferase
LTKKFDNLIVVRTFSKTFGLAGLRLGYVIANKKFIDVFTRVLQYPYPLNTLAIEAGALALQKAEQISETIETIKQERSRIIKKLRESGAFDVFDSKANFVLFDARGADKRIYTALLEQGISIRKLGKIGKHEGCLRVTVGTKEMNSKFLLAIRDLLQ